MGMSVPQKNLRRDTRVFISAVTRELGSVRKLVKKGLEDNDYHAVEQDNFPPDYRDLIDKLRARIASCDAVIHIAGHCYGAEPRQRPVDAPRRSYTQLEYDLARELEKPVYVFLTGEDFPAEPYEAEDDERAQLQQAHRQQLADVGRDYSRIKSREELDQKIRSLQLKIESLQEELTHVDAKVTASGRRLSRWLALVLVLTVILLGAVGSIRWLQQQEGKRAEVARLAEDAERRAQQQERDKQEQERKAAEEARQQAQKIVQVEQEFADRFLLQLITNKEISAEDARQRALKELPALVKLPLKEIRAMIDRNIPAAGPETSVKPLDRARTALAQGNLDAVFQAADEQRQEGRELAMLEGTAALAKFRESPKSEWNERALAAFRRALALSDRTQEPQAWTDAAIAVASLLHILAKYSEAGPLMIEAQTVLEKKHGVESKEVAIILNNRAQLLQATNRLAEAEPLMRRALAIEEQSYGTEHTEVARDLSNLALLLKISNRIAVAEPLTRRALAIDEQSNGTEHPDVAIRLNNLAGLLFATNRLAEAEPLMRRALAIDELSYGAEHPSVASNLNNLAQLLLATNRLAEAEPLMRRALAIDEQSYGAEHPSVARDLNNLATLLLNPKLLAEPEQLMRLALAEMLLRRALAIDERSYGAEHPDVARDLGNLSTLFYATNRLADAEPLMRRALAIDEQSFGTEHPDVGGDIDNLAQLLLDTNRLVEAEPLFRRLIVIDAILSATTGHEQPDMQSHIETYRKTCEQLRVTDDEIQRQIDEAMETRSPLKPFVPEVERLLGPAQPVADLLAKLDRQYKEEGKTDIYFLAPDQAISPHLDELLGASAVDIGLNEPITPYLEKLLGPTKSTQEVLNELDRQYREAGKFGIWFLPLSEPISPRLDELLGPLPQSDASRLR
jgi:hypothetical protein